MTKQYLFFLALVSMFFFNCSDRPRDFKLPYFGRSQVVEKVVDGKVQYDTIPHTIGAYSFYNQDSVSITNETFDGKIYVADFFFTSCPTICPVMKKQMLRVYEQFEDNDRVFILSHTIDPEYDNVQILKVFAEALDVSAPKWNFVTGDKEEIYTIGEKSYMVTAGEDEEAPGGYIHSGAFILIDGKRRVRGVYDGTDADQVNILLSDIEWLLKEI